MANEQNGAFDPSTSFAVAGIRPDLVRLQEELRAVRSRGTGQLGILHSGGQGEDHRDLEQGKEAIVESSVPTSSVAKDASPARQVRIATATAMTDCTLMRMEKAAIVRILHDEPAFSEMFVAHLLTRTIHVEADLVDQLFNSSEKRLARALLSPG